MDRLPDDEHSLEFAEPVADNFDPEPFPLESADSLPFESWPPESDPALESESRFDKSLELDPPPEPPLDSAPPEPEPPLDPYEVPDVPLLPLSPLLLLAACLLPAEETSSLHNASAPPTLEEPDAPGAAAGADEAVDELHER